MSGTKKNLCLRILRTIQASEIETDQLGKAKSFRLFSIARPFMRSFHAAWFCFFIAFTSWFGIQPLLPTIRKELGLTKVQLAHSGMASIAATIVIRVIIGPVCDLFGPKRAMTLILICGAIPMALAGLVKNATSLIILRLCIGVLGGTFVPCQFWTTAMFNVNVVGTANALVGGWGNLGGGFTFILMPGIFELVKVCGADEFLAWKIAVVVPAVICIVTGLSILCTCDDCPQGKWDLRIMPDEVTVEATAPEEGEDDDDVSMSEKRDSFPCENQDDFKMRRESENIHKKRKRSSMQYEIPDDIKNGKNSTSVPEKRNSLQYETRPHLKSEEENAAIRTQRSKSMSFATTDGLATRRESITIHRKRKRSSLQYENPDDLSFLGKINPAFSTSETGLDGHGKQTLGTISENQVNNKVEDSKSTPGMSCWSYFTIAILIIQYGMCFGVEISVNTVMNLYFLYRFKIEGCVETPPDSYNSSSMVNVSSSLLLNSTMPSSTTPVTSELNQCSILNQNQASLIASLFGLMNLFARALGGIFSDVLRKFHAIPGRIFALFICLLCEGVMLIVFSQMTTIPTAVVCMVVFSLCVQMSEGATFAIVPYVIVRRVGVVAGLVGAGGNLGALIWNTIWSELVAVDPSRYFWIVGIAVLCGSFLSFLTVVQDSRMIHLCRTEKHSEPETVSTRL